MGKEVVKKVLRSVVFLSVGVFLFWLVYRKTNFSEIWSLVKETKWAWVLLSIGLGLLSHILRSLRWKLLIRPLGYNPRFTTLFYSVMIMYFSNLAIPRSGELIRCATASKYEKIPFSSLLGTVVTERIIDMLMLIILTVIVIFSQMGLVIDFVKDHPTINNTLSDFSKSLPILLFLGVLSLVVIFLLYKFRHRLRKNKLIDKLYKFTVEFWYGIKTVANLDGKWMFIFYTLGIWLLYFLMIYVVFKAFDFTAGLNLLQGLVVFVLASFGMVFPSPGGMGSWHFMAIEALKLYGIAGEPYGRAFAFVAHESQLFMLITVGLFSVIALSFVKIKNSTIKTSENEKQN